MDQVVRTACSHDCPDACALLVTVRDGRAIEVAPNPAHPITGRHLCVKVDRYLERVYSPDRVLHPLGRDGQKGGGQFVRISWDEALDTIAGRWRSILSEDGGEAILPYCYLGSMGLLSALGPVHAVFHALGASRLERTICGGQGNGLRSLCGTMGTEPENLEDADLIVAWGIDPVSTTVHTWDLIRRARRSGTRLGVIDPYRSRTVVQADLHVQPYPGTDGALALGLAHVILGDGLEDRDYLDRHATGVGEFRAAVRTWTPEHAGAVTGLQPEAIAELAREYARTKPAAIRYGVGMQRALGSGMALRAIDCLPALTGQWRHAAGGIVDARSLRMANLAALMRPDLGAPTRTLNMIQLGRHLTDPSLTPPIRALYVFNSNPAVIAADQTRVLHGLAREDLFTVVHEQFLTDTARYADIVLPATTMLEQDDVLGSWGYHYFALQRRAVEPRGDAKSNTEVARLLAARLALTDTVFEQSDDGLIALALDGSRAEQSGASLRRLQAEDFVRVGAGKGVAPFAGGGFPTRSGKFEFVSEDLARAGHGPLPIYVPPAEAPETRPDLAPRYPLRLLTRKRHQSINSSYGRLPVLARAEPHPCVEIHPADASARGIADGQRVHVWNDRGAVTCPAVVTDRVKAGVVSVAFGHWIHDGGSA